MKLKSIYDERWIIGILIVNITIRLVIVSLPQIVYWDAAVYAGMAKYLFSYGTIGLWESIRPLGLPFVLGFFWKLGLPIVAVGRAISIITGLVCVYYVYLIGKEISGKTVGIISAIVLSITPTFLFLSLRVLTDTIALMLMLIGIYYFLRRSWIFSGVFMGLSFLFKFTYLIIGLIAAGILMYKPLFKRLKDDEEIREVILYIVGLFSIIIPILIFNAVYYKNPIQPFLAARDMIERVVACNVTYAKPWSYYFYALFKENILLSFLVLGIKPLKKHKFMLISFCIIPFLYFTLQHCKDLRYLIMIIPLLAILSAIGVCWSWNKLKIKPTIAVLINMLLVIHIMFGMHAIIIGELQFSGNEPDFFRSELKGPILTTSPFFILYSDEKIIPLYYSLSIYSEQSYLDLADHIYFDECYLKTDPEYPDFHQELFNKKLTSMTLIKNETIKGCKHYLYSK